MSDRPALAALVGVIDAPPREAMKRLTAYREEVAHELAEKIRAHDGVEPDDYRQPQAWREGYSDGLQDGADLIDPKKEGQ